MYLKETAEGLELGLSLSQAKKVYVALFRALHAGGRIDDLDEDDMLLTLQTYLQRRARLAGVDATDHSAWDAFLGIVDSVPCDVRVARRRPMN
jgi:hypothetical protein